jgi:hypothetical protein
MTGPNVPVPDEVLSSAKAASATWTLLGGWIALLVTSAADGSVSWDEGYKLAGAAIAAATAVRVVWKTKNKPLS